LKWYDELAAASLDNSTADITLFKWKFCFNSYAYCCRSLQQDEDKLLGKEVGCGEAFCITARGDTAIICGRKYRRKAIYRFP
jgi:hypothetical protein